MKSYEQMAADVLRRAEDCHRRRRTLTRSAVAASGALLVVLAGVWCTLPFGGDGGSGDPLVQEQPAPKASSQLQVSYVLEDGWTVEKMKPQIETEMRYKLSVIDTRGLTAEQREVLRQEMVAQQEQELLAFDSEFYSGHSVGGGGVNSAWNNALFSTLRVGVFQLDISEEKTVESLRAECSSVYGEAEFGIHSGNFIDQKVPYQAKLYDGTEQRMEKETRHGNVFLHAMGVALDGATYDRIQADGVFYIRWKPAAKLYEVLNDDPQKALSDFSDQLTIIVNYTDGSSESHRLDIVFHDDGTINAVCRGVEIK